MAQSAKTNKDFTPICGVRIFDFGFSAKFLIFVANQVADVAANSEDSRRCDGGAGPAVVYAVLEFVRGVSVHSPSERRLSLCP